MFEAPAYSCTDDDGKPWNSEELRGLMLHPALGDERAIYVRVHHMRNKLSSLTSSRSSEGVDTSVNCCSFSYLKGAKRAWFGFNLGKVPIADVA